MDFVAWPDARLKQKAVLAAGVDEALRAAGGRLLAAAREHHAYGLAAAHIGEVLPVVVVSGDDVVHRVLFNPRVVATGGDAAAGEEGSVSLPGVRVSVERPAWAEIEFMDADGAVATERFEGFIGRVAQHEIDQMNGVFFLERVSRLKREMALKKAAKLTG